MNDPGARPGAITAVDIAIVPPENVRERLAALNARTLAPPTGFRFGSTRLPHITLAQQCVRRSDLGKLESALGALLAREVPVEISATAISRPSTTAVLGVALTPSLASLHRRIMDVLLRFPAADPAPGAFFTDGEPPRPADCDWVRNFRRRSAHARFEPHITLGVGCVDAEAPMPAFSGDHIGLFHLGRFCTCRGKLAEWTLTAPRG